MSRTAARPRSSEALPYRIEFRDGSAEERRILARAFSLQLAHAIFRAALGEHPEARITLRRGPRIIADSQDPRSRADPPVEAGK